MLQSVIFKSLIILYKHIYYISYIYQGNLKDYLLVLLLNPQKDLALF